ncbi:Metal homeostatis protein BSD2 [Trametes pubescens]|uniref:Metal homeostatis protein BSD2 n=1 Tax=Trametes pubescens TaxID=154538 RepID=A0A1M2VSI8_TRAPU|nr:Metal homeostatis protein BSD2 [Trametes pubescens]
MPARYAPLPNPHTDPDAMNEMEAAFDDSDDDDDGPQPLTARGRNGYQALSNAEPEHATRDSDDAHHHHGGAAAAPGAYDFENADFDYIRPPPGSPPGPSARALPNEFGNSNGLVPAFQESATDAMPSSSRGPNGWFRRTAQAVLPTHYVQRLGLADERPQGPVGGGFSNDGVFANVTAKPSRGIRVQDGDDVLIVPEEVQKEVPPSYAQAQADAVPPYWETTIHAPSASNTPGDVIIDSLPTGSLFSFLWNMLVSISFQFVGFLLTYLLHTTHAAKFGSRAGLGITLIQYGFALRSKEAYVSDQQDVWGGWKPEEPRPTFGTAAEAEAYYNNLNLTATMPPTPSADIPTDGYISPDATTEWLSFLLMTIGWFMLLTSVLGFWRVKRWERGILASQGESPAPATPEEQARSAAILNSIERAFGLHGLADGSLLRSGLGFSAAAIAEPAEDDDEDDHQPTRNAYVLPLDPSNPERNERLARAYADEARLHQDLRSAGLL